MFGVMFLGGVCFLMFWQVAWISDVQRQAARTERRNLPGQSLKTSQVLTYCKIFFNTLQSYRKIWKMTVDWKDFGAISFNFVHQELVRPSLFASLLLLGKDETNKPSVSKKKQIKVGSYFFCVLNGWIFHFKWLNFSFPCFGAFVAAPGVRLALGLTVGVGSVTCAFWPKVWWMFGAPGRLPTSLDL